MRKTNSIKSLSALIVPREVDDVYTIQLIHLKNTFNVKNIYDVYYSKYNVTGKWWKQMFKKKGSKPTMPLNPPSS